MVPIIREYGSSRHVVIVLHGGPAAVGDLGPLAEELGKQWHVLEPFQRGSGKKPLTVATHVRDLDGLIRARCQGERRPILIGHSWGAMLALAYAAEHPIRSEALVLVGCGTFSVNSRDEFKRRLEARFTVADRTELAEIERNEIDPDRRLAVMGSVMTRVYGHDLDEAEVPDNVASIDAVAHQETWADMMRLQQDGVYPAAFSAIVVPVLMLHGDADPHPGRLIREDLRTFIPQLEYLELPECGHSPWLERQAREPFFRQLNSWLLARLSS